MEDDEARDRRTTIAANKLMRISTATAATSYFIGSAALYAFQTTFVGDYSENPVNTHVTIDFPIHAVFHGHGIGAHIGTDSSTVEVETAGKIVIDSGVKLDVTGGLIFIDVPCLEGSMSMSFILYLVSVAEVRS